LAIIDAAARILSTPPGNIKPGDLMVPRSSIGTTVAVAILMGRVRKEILPDLTDIHAHNLAHILMSTNPWILLDHLNDQDKFATYISNIRVKDKPSSPFIETEMCPDRTPLAIRNTYLRGRIDSPTLKRGDYMHIIAAFVECFYPDNLPRVKKTLGNHTTEELYSMMATPGEFAKVWKSRDRRCTFDPPTWIDLNLPPMDTQKTNLPTVAEEQLSLDEEGDFTSPLDGFQPLNHVGVPADDFSTLTPLEQKAQVILNLPSTLQKLVSPTEAAAIVMALGIVPDEDIAHILHPQEFGKFLNQLQWKDTPPPSPPSEYRVRIRIQSTHENPGTTSSRAAVTWITLASTFLHAKGHTFQIVKAPFEIDDTPLTVTPEGIPTEAVTMPYTHALP